jgi:hypothetical protein
MIYTTSQYTNHTGLGSKLFAWGRAKVLQQAYDVKMLQQQWISVRGAGVTRGGIDYSKILGKIYLFNNFKNDVGEISWLEWQLNLNGQFPTVFVNNLSEALEVLTGENKLIIFRWHGGHYFTDLENYRLLLRESLRRITRTAVLKTIIHPEPFIGINIRLGNDFVDPNSGQGGHYRTPMDWFLRNIDEVRKLHGNLPIYVVSDGTQHQLAPFKKFPNVTLVNQNYAIQDLLFLTQASVYMGVGTSTFSAWASFLGNMPSYAAEVTPFSGFQLKNAHELP